MTVRSSHRKLVDSVARRFGLTGRPLPNRPLQNRSPRLANPGPRLGAAAGRAAAAHHDPSRRRILRGWQARIGSWVRGARS